jgi:hypothetical protein
LHCPNDFIAEAIPIRISTSFSVAIKVSVSVSALIIAR